MNKVCIATLTHDAPQRARFLQLTVETLLQSTPIPVIDWYIHCNGYNEDIIAVVEQLKTIYQDKVNFTFTYSEINKGVGAGINALNSLLLDYEYTLFLEGDWITLPEHISGHTNWFNNCVTYLDTHSHIDQILLRRYVNDVDDRQYGYGYWIKPDNIKSITITDNRFIELVKRDYTNNPHIRRNSKYYSLDIFPLKEFYDIDGTPTEIKGKSDWGQAEIQAESKGHYLGSSYLAFGNMVHADQWRFDNNWDDLVNNITACDKYDESGLSKCKYGYLFPKEKFCGLCDHTKDFTHLEKHNRQYEQTYYQ